MISFYPGPSQVYAQVPQWVQEGYDAGVLGMNHRSEAFQELYESVIRLMREKLEVPIDYTLYFTSSATECWEIIAQSFTQKGGLHVYNGAFGEKWAAYARKLRPLSLEMPFPLEGSPRAQEWAGEAPELLCLTHNETSNGTALREEVIADFRHHFPNALLALDATSSLGGAQLPLEQGDIWYASVQKCLGLPAGMGVLICSPRAVDRALWLDEKAHYNSFTSLHKNMLMRQTTHTPNVLGVYLLKRSLEHIPPISETAHLLGERMRQWERLFTPHCPIKPLVAHAALRSLTVLPLQGNAELITSIKHQALRRGFLLGNGYGPWKETTLRIANFPAIRTEDFTALWKYLSEELS
jgi:phosphoserine aminotransferase